MEYVSTRDKQNVASGARAIVSGISPEGGLFVPRRFPSFDHGQMEALAGLGYAQRAARVLAPWLDEFSMSQLSDLCAQAYNRFDDEAVAPIHALADSCWALELWHGPTLAFKDMALQLLPRLMIASSRLVGETRDILILVATSGDTGKAALEGFADVPGVKICVFYPEGGVSEAQRLQMVTQTGHNTRVVAVRGNFDDAQTGVKKIFTDAQCVRALDARGAVLSSANSINLGRLLPQIAYYFSAYADLLGRGAIKQGDKINICVPTGNFGNILAADYARRMGLPVNRLVCASNTNNVLTDFIRTGTYDRNRAFHLTTSPSMDILISSNLERELFELAGQDDRRVNEWMTGLKETGRYALDGAALASMQSLLWGGYADEAAVSREISRAFREEGYLIDPHTAVALRVARDYRAQTGDAAPMLVVSTASPYKFGRSVLQALEGEAQSSDDFDCCERLAALSGGHVPCAIAELREKKIRHKDVYDKEAMWQAVQPILE